MISRVVVLPGAVCYAELASALPEAGGDYAYLSRGIVPPSNFDFACSRNLAS